MCAHTEIPSPVVGVVLEILVAEDETADVGATLAVIGDASEAPAGGDAPADADLVAEPEEPSTRRTSLRSCAVLRLRTRVFSACWMQ